MLLCEDNMLLCRHHIANIVSHGLCCGSIEIQIVLFNNLDCKATKFDVFQLWRKPTFHWETATPMEHVGLA